MVVNNDCWQVLSNDLEALSGLLFEIGAGNLLGPNLYERPAVDRKKIQKQLAKRHKAVVDEAQETQTHSEMQYHLLTLGRALGYDVVVARKDRSRQYNGQPFSFLSLPSLPPLPVPPETSQTISLIDIIWLEKETGRLICAFEVEKSTSIYSTILRLTDLTCSLLDHATTLYLVVPDSRQKEVEIQLTRPSIRQTNTPIRYILMSELRMHYVDSGTATSCWKRSPKPCEAVNIYIRPFQSMGTTYFLLCWVTLHCNLWLPVVLGTWTTNNAG